MLARACVTGLAIIALAGARRRQAKPSGACGSRSTPTASYRASPTAPLRSFLGWSQARSVPDAWLSRAGKQDQCDVAVGLEARPAEPGLRRLQAASPVSLQLSTPWLHARCSRVGHTWLLVYLSCLVYLSTCRPQVVGRNLWEIVEDLAADAPPGSRLIESYVRK